MKMQIAIDGPAGAGKSTVAKAVAKKLHINYMDTGAMYRAMAYAMLARGIDPNDAARVLPALDEVDIAVRYENGVQQVLIDGEDVMDRIRTEKIGRGASDISVIPDVRVRLAQIQRETAEHFDMVMDGREIGTYVLPNAPVKFFITASSKVRAERRRKDLLNQGIDMPLEELEQQIISRDYQDMNREFMPLKQAEDAIYLDTSEMPIDQVIDAVILRIQEVYG